MPNVPLYAITYGNGQFVAVGKAGALLTSSDGSNWISQVSGTTENLWGTTFGSSSFVAVGENATTLTSPDGIDWSVNVVHSPPGYPQSPPLYAITYGKGVFVVVGAGAYTSADGTNWNAYPIQVPGLVGSVGYGNGVFAAVMKAGYGPYLATSTDAMSWNVRFWPEFSTANSITFGAGSFVAAGGLNDARAWNDWMATSVSTNGNDWTGESVIGRGSHYLHYVTHGGGLFFALGTGRLLPTSVDVFATSVDGFNWSTNAFPTSSVLTAAAFGADTYVVVGENGTILQSDPLTQTPMEPPRLTIPAGSPLVLSIQGTSGEHLRLEYVDELAASNDWQTLGEFWLAGVTNVWGVSNAATSHRFFRAIVLP